ncbi:unnamed protein product [Peronospora belbahrii]|uniref:Uncharacterized protein n=1 Tax=Peronospora belbahrii TaxID=622444 RepID=A0ABN8D5U0_9STRA|nr:unnamed protein product [Peronospora belbahrii]
MDTLAATNSKPVQADDTVYRRLRFDTSADEERWFELSRFFTWIKSYVNKKKPQAEMTDDAVTAKQVGRNNVDAIINQENPRRGNGEEIYKNAKGETDDEKLDAAATTFRTQYEQDKVADDEFISKGYLRQLKDIMTAHNIAVQGSKKSQIMIADMMIKVFGEEKTVTILRAHQQKEEHQILQNMAVTDLMRSWIAKRKSVASITNREYSSIYTDLYRAAIEKAIQDLKNKDPLEYPKAKIEIEALKTLLKKPAS